MLRHGLAVLGLISLAMSAPPLAAEPEQDPLETAQYLLDQAASEKIDESKQINYHLAAVYALKDVRKPTPLALEALEKSFDLYLSNPDQYYSPRPWDLMKLFHYSPHRAVRQALYDEYSERLAEATANEDDARLKLLESIRTYTNQYGRTVKERAEQLEDELQNAGDAPLREKTKRLRKLLEYVSEHTDELDINTGFDVWLKAGFTRDEIFVDPDAKAAKLREIDRLIAKIARSGDGEKELIFRSARIYMVDTPFENQVFQGRQLLRRAAELRSLESRMGRNIIVSVGEDVDNLRERDRATEAVAVGEELLSILSSAGLEPDYDLLRIQGQALSAAGRTQEADESFRKAFEAARGSSMGLGRDPQQFIANQWAFFLNAAGAFELAEEPGKYAADKAVEMGPREAIWVQKARYNYGVALLGQGQAAKALPYFEEALPLQRSEQNSGWRAGSAYVRRDTIWLLTTLARARAQVPGNERGAFDAAVEASNLVRDLRRERLQGAGDKEKGDPGAAALAKAVAKGERRDPLSPAYDMVLASGWQVRENAPDVIDAVFRAAQDLMLGEAGDAITLAAARDLAGTGALGDLIRQRQDAAQSIVSLNADYRKASQGNDAQKLASLQKQLEGLALKVADFDKQLTTDFPEYGELVAPSAAGLDAVQGALGDDEALIILLPSETDHHAILLTRESANWYREAEGAEKVAKLVARLRCRLDEATCSMADSFDLVQAEEGSDTSPVDEFYPRFDRAAAHALYGMTVAPFADALAGKKLVYVSAAGPMSGLPLATLVQEAPEDGQAESGDVEVLQGTKWLGDQFAFVTLPSVSALTLPRRDEDAADGAGLVGYGAPVLEGAGEGGTRSASARRTRLLRSAPASAASFFDAADDGQAMHVDPAKLRTLDPLPGTERELMALANAIGSGAESLRLGPAATEMAVKSDDRIGKAEIVVFATHGLLPGEMGQAAEPGLVFTPPMQGDAQDDGLLTAGEVASLDLSARWVILSACNTASADSATGADALSGLARSFLYAGADSLLASHWRVADDASAALTVASVEATRDGLSQAEALQTAQIAIRMGRRRDGSDMSEWAPHWAHPSAWAPFTLISDRDR